MSYAKHYATAMARKWRSPQELRREVRITQALIAERRNILEQALKLGQAKRAAAAAARLAQHAGEVDALRDAANNLFCGEEG